MKKIFVVIIVSAMLAASALSATSIMNQIVLAKINCDSNSCSGGSSFGTGGAGGRVSIEDGTFTQSGGGGNKILPGGGGEHIVCGSDGCVRHGGSSGP